MEEWMAVDYWAVYETANSDNELFRGSKTACKKYARSHGGTVCHVISERVTQ